MSTETRIGIVAGLLIVVVASVYFFYGSGRRDEEVLVAATPKPSALKIPISNEKPPIKPAAGSVYRPTPAGPIAQNTPRSPAFYPPQPAATTAAKPIVLTPIAPSHLGAAGPAPDRIAGAMGIDKYKWNPPANKAPSNGAASPSTTNTQAPTMLRTNPSPILVEATKSNLDADPRPAQSPAQAYKTEKKPVFPEREVGRVKLESESIDKPTGARGDAPGGMQRHTVAKGDTLTGLAKQYLGSTRKSAEIVAANPDLKGRRKLKPGETILIPQAAASTEHSGELELAPSPTASDRTYTVENGDTIYAIAKKTLGDSKRWKEVFELNKDQLKGDPRRLKAGMTLKLPAA